MTTTASAISPEAMQERVRLAWVDRQDYATRQGLMKLLAIKDSDIRLLTLEQCRYAVLPGQWARVSALRKASPSRAD